LEEKQVKLSIFIQNKSNMTINNSEITLNDIMNVVLGLGAKIEDLGGKIDKAETRLTSVESKIVRVEVRLTGVEDKIGKVETRLIGVESELVGVESKINEVGNNLTGLREDFDRFATLTVNEFAKINTKIDDLISEVNNLNLQDAKREAEIARIHESFHKLERRLDKFTPEESQNKKFEEDLNLLKTKINRTIDEFNVKISYLETQRNSQLAG
jgi:chromosome segregation ATPase